MASKLTVVTHPDLFVSPGFRILAIGNYKFRTEVQDLVGILWPDEDVVFYSVDDKDSVGAKSPTPREWAFVHSKLADIIIVDILHVWENTWPLLLATPAKIYFKVHDDGRNYQDLINTLKLTHIDQVFHTVEEAVKAAVSARL